MRMRHRFPRAVRQRPKSAVSVVRQSHGDVKSAVFISQGDQREPEPEVAIPLLSSEDQDAEAAQAAQSDAADDRGEQLPDRDLNKRPSRFSRIVRDTWTPEILGWIISAATVGAIIVIIPLSFNSQLLSAWSARLPLNTLISPSASRRSCPVRSCSLRSPSVLGSSHGFGTLSKAQRRYDSWRGMTRHEMA
jgi:hypothetical protein